MPISLFLDSSIYFSGFAYEGISAAIMNLARQRTLVIFSTPQVLKEADQNLKQNAPQNAREDFQHFLKQNLVHLLPPPDPKDFEPYEAVAGLKNARLLTAAVSANIKFFLTLDRKSFLENPALVSSVPLKILTPRDVLQA